MYLKHKVYVTVPQRSVGLEEVKLDQVRLGFVSDRFTLGKKRYNCVLSFVVWSGKAT